MNAWIWITGAAKTVWSKLKKLPGWAIGLLLLLTAVIWYCVKLIANGKEIKQIQQERVVIEQERYQIIEKIRDEEDAAADHIIKKYDAELKKLNEKTAELSDSLAEGPSGIADAWKEYLLGESK